MKYVHLYFASSLQTSSIYVVSRVSMSKNFVKKLFWMLVLLATISGCCYQTCRFMNLYFKYPIQENYRLEPQRNAFFPAVTICNQNRRKAEFETCLYEILSPKDCTSISPDNRFNNGKFPIKRPLVLPERRSYRSYLQTQRGATERFLAKYSKLSIDKRWRYGHQYKDLIEKCSFRDKSCKNNFSLFSNSRYGNCFTFNKLNKLSVPSADTSLVGSMNGLKLVLNAEINEYVAISHTVGFRIVIHDPFEEPDPEIKGMNIIPGYETNVLLKQTLIKRLSEPYKDQCLLYSNNKPFDGSQTLCMQACIQEYNYAKCGCTESSFITLLGRRQCNMENSTDVYCLDSVLDYIAIYETNCVCPLPCVSAYYNEISTMSIWLSKASFFKGKENATKLDWKNYRASHAKIHIFFSTLERTVHEQVPVFHESEIFSHLGGEFGLWLGLSLAALFDFGETALHFIKNVMFGPIKCVLFPV
ncbi:amiloride-sensitive sodium channel subunit alpha [Trichonephila clavipes]|uniref:Amiloride-sensitive sodium channel subunit alpha n=1 Tax=Trichonephila clavipes TaxID=2585209 RepID=A0A8X6WG56_TRICX|nr:amiloride-sensitive sodium channel subunit alpha [Trichonephila clavipes]